VDALSCFVCRLCAKFPNVCRHILHVVQVFAAVTKKLSNIGMHPTPRQQVFHVRCIGARVMPGVRPPVGATT